MTQPKARVVLVSLSGLFLSCLARRYNCLWVCPGGVRSCSAGAALGTEAPAAECDKNIAIESSLVGPTFCDASRLGRPLCRPKRPGTCQLPCCSWIATSDNSVGGFPPGSTQVLGQLCFHFFLQTVGANDPYVRNPIPNNGNDLILVPDLCGQDQTTILKFFLDLLVGD